MPRSMRDHARRLVACLLCVLSSTALAQTWLGGSGNNWSTGANWSGGSAPANDGTASIEFSPAGTTYTPVVDVPWGIAAMTFTSPGYSLGGMALTFAGSAFITVKDPGNRIANAVAIPTGLTIEGHEDFLISGDVSGAGTLHKAGSGTLTLSGATWPTGQVTVAEGTLRIGDGTTGPASVGALLVDGAVSFADSTTVTGTIAGGGRLTVEAGATVTNTSGAAFTHAGSTGIHGHLTGSPAGSIDNNAPLTIGPSGELTTAGGEVGSLSGNGFLNLTSGTFRAGSDNSSTTFSGVLGGPGNFTKTGTGTLTLQTSFWFNTSSVVTVEAGGTLRIGSAFVWPGAVGPLVANGHLAFAGHTSVLEALTGTGSVTVELDANVTNQSTEPFRHQGPTNVYGILTGAAAGSIDNNAPLTLGPLGNLNTSDGTVGSLAGNGFLFVSAGTFRAGSDNSSTTFSGALGGPGNFTKTGTGTLTLQTGFWFDASSVVTVEAGGTLRIGSAFSWPGAVGPLVANGHLAFAGQTSVLEALTGTGSVTVELDANVTNQSTQPFRHQGPTNVYGILTGAAAGSIDNNAPLTLGPLGNLNTSDGTVGSLAGNGFLYVSAGTFRAGGDNSSTTFSGALGGPGNFTKTGTGTLTLQTGFWFDASSVVTVEAGGTLRIGSAFSWPGAVGPLVANGHLAFAGHTSVLEALTGTGSVTVEQDANVTNQSTQPFRHQGPTSVYGILTGAAAGSIDNNAPLTLGPLGNLNTSDGTVGSLSGSGFLFIGAGNFAVGSDNSSTTFAGAIGGSGSLTKAGGGTLTLSGNSQSFGGTTTVTAGGLSVSGWLGGPVVVAAGASLEGTGTLGAITLAAGGALAPGPGPSDLATGSLSLAGTYTAQLFGGVPGSQHDRLVVTGSVALNGATLVLSGGYVPNLGDQIVLIANDGSEAVTGTFAGLPEGSTIVFNGRTLRISYAGGSGNDVVLSVASHTVTPSVNGGNGTIAPVTPQTVAAGATVAFTLAPSPGYVASVGGTCGGTLSGNTFTTSPVTADCTVVAGFAPATYAVTPSAGPNGTIAPGAPQTVAHGATASFTVTPNAGYTASVGGTCGGTLTGTTYVTNAITSDCTVAASFTAINHVVTPSAGPNGSISPATPQAVAHGATTTFTVTPAPGYAAAMGGSCGGSLVATTFTTSPITADCTVAATFAVVNRPRLANISTRMQVLTGNDVLIGGFIIAGFVDKTVVVRARGPSLVPFGIANALANPQLQLVRSSDQATIASNDNWQAATNAAALAASGFAPSNDLEAAILVKLPPGAYTALVSGVGGTTGVGIVEVFEVDAPEAPVENISTRGQVRTGNDAMIGGFVIEGSTHAVVVRARGPSLVPFGIANALANPRLTLVRSSDQQVIATNDDWQSDPGADALTSSGFAPSNPLEAAVRVVLPPGAYTVIVTGVGDTTGVAIVEVFSTP